MLKTLCCGLFLVVTGTCRADAVLSISPSIQVVSTGSEVTIQVSISGLGDGVALGTYDVDVGFDPQLLSYQTANFGSDLNVSGLGDIQEASPSRGAVELFELSLDSPFDLISTQPPAFTLATMTFGTFSPGLDSPIALSIDALGDAYGNSIDADIAGGSVSIVKAGSPIPEPNSFLLIISAVPACMVWRKHESSNQTQS